MFAGRRFYVRNRLQPFATVCNRLQPFATVLRQPSWQKVAVPMGKVAKGLIFGCFKSCVASFRLAGVALCDMWLHDCRGRKLPCLWEKRHKASLSGSFKCEATFCVGCVELYDMWTCDRRTTEVAESCRGYRESCNRSFSLRFFAGIALAGLLEVVTRCKFSCRRGIF